MLCVIISFLPNKMSSLSQTLLFSPAQFIFFPEFLLVLFVWRIAGWCHQGKMTPLISHELSAEAL